MILFIIIIFFAGLISNIICLVTLCRPGLRQGQGSVNIILASMAAIGQKYRMNDEMVFTSQA